MARAPARVLPAAAAMRVGGPGGTRGSRPRRSLRAARRRAGCAARPSWPRTARRSRRRAQCRAGARGEGLRLHIADHAVFRALETVRTVEGDGGRTEDAEALEQRLV